MTEEQRYALAWGDLRRRYRLALAVVLAFIALQLLSRTVLAGQGWLASPLLTFPFFILLAIVSLRLVGFRCPRCAHRFFSLRPFGRDPESLHYIVESQKSGSTLGPRCPH